MVRAEWLSSSKNKTGRESLSVIATGSKAFAASGLHSVTPPKLCPFATRTTGATAATAAMMVPSVIHLIVWSWKLWQLPQTMSSKVRDKG
jgi:hypothetical protein